MTIPTSKDIDRIEEDLDRGRIPEFTRQSVLDAYRKLLVVFEKAEAIVVADEDGAFSLLTCELAAACEKLEDLGAALYEIRGGTAPCPMRRRCHGPQKFCDKCGDVSYVCDDGACDVHSFPEVET